MFITNIKIKNYKSIEEINLNLTNKKMIALIGTNNVGKTNILEAINKIKSFNKKDYYYNSSNRENMNFNSQENTNNLKSNSDDFYFELTIKSFVKSEPIIMHLDSKKQNKDGFLKNQVDEIINAYQDILKQHFKDKYILENNFNIFVEDLKKIVIDPYDSQKYYSKNNLIINEKTFYSLDNNQEKLKLYINNFFKQNYLFSEKGIKLLTEQIIEFWGKYKDLDQMIKNYDFTNKIFYISTSLKNNFQIFETIMLNAKNIELVPENNYFSALIYNNDAYKSDLKKINKELTNNISNLNEKKLEIINQLLKEKFQMLILNDDFKNNDKYIVYPKLILKEDRLNSVLVAIKKNNTEFIEDVALMSEGLRSKLILKLNLQYCKKYKDREIILLIDEPDRSLHITAILELYHEFQDLVNNTKTKIIYTTHSPYLLGNIFENHKNILVIEKNDKNKTCIPDHLQIDIKELNDTCLGKMISITGSKHLIINSLNNYSNKYVTVEGKTDYEFYTWYNKYYIKNKNLYFISIQGKNKGELIGILKKLNLNFICLYDNDCEIKKEETKFKIKYSDIFKELSDSKIKDLESLLKNNKKKHCKLINDEKMDKLHNYYKKRINDADIKKKIDKIFNKINEKLDSLND